ncbi:UNVERIFIED_CONTAM: hypothetical protein NCL1_54992 [Trichonephila clavipes]
MYKRCYTINKIITKTGLFKTKINMNSAVVGCFLITVLIGSTSVSSEGDLQGRHLFIAKRSAAQQFPLQILDTAIRRIKKRFSKGNSGCVPPAGQICCNNFIYDYFSNKCREVV